MLVFCTYYFLNFIFFVDFIQASTILLIKTTIIIMKQNTIIFQVLSKNKPVNQKNNDNA